MDKNFADEMFAKLTPADARWKRQTDRKEFLRKAAVAAAIGTAVGVAILAVGELIKKNDEN